MSGVPDSDPSTSGRQTPQAENVKLRRQSSGSDFPVILSAGQKSRRRRLLNYCEDVLLFLPVMGWLLVALMLSLLLGNQFLRFALLRATQSNNHSVRWEPAKLGKAGMQLPQQDTLLPDSSPQLVVRFETCGGLFNQHYCRLAGIAVAIELGAQAIIFGPALYRNSYQKQEKWIKWLPAEAATIWDMAKLKRYLSGKGMKLRSAPAYATVAWGPDAYNPLSIPADATLGPFYLEKQLLRLQNLVAAAHRNITNHMRAQLSRDDWQSEQHGAAAGNATAARRLQQAPPQLLLHYGCPLFAVRAQGCSLMTEAARHLDFAPAMYALARKITAGMARALQQPSLPVVPFNGLHLRMEPDAKLWMRIMGGPKKLFGSYLEACGAMGMTPDTPLYAASAIFANASDPAALAKLTALQAAVASHVFHKTMFLSQEELDGLHTEQAGLVDFLVLAQSRRYVGFEASTFSFFVREWRYLQGIPRNTTRLLQFPGEVHEQMQRDKFFGLGGTFS